MHNAAKKINKILQNTTFGLFSALLVFGMTVLVTHFIRLQNGGYIRLRHFRQPEAGQTLPISQVRGWMTFRYINSVFKLDQSFLQNTLGINDKRYPNLSINSLAKSSGVNEQEMLNRVITVLQK